MATKIVCDLCGNTISGLGVVARHCFGPIEGLPGVHQMALQSIIQQFPPNSQQSAGVGVLGNQKSNIQIVDLCPRCVVPWMARVKEITSASDPN